MSAMERTGINDLSQGWHDEPINEPRQDRFGRARFSEITAALINSNHRSDSSVVYGLEGPWGSGKSSAIALTRRALEGFGGSKWVTVDFSPWATVGTEAMIEEFFAAIADAAPELVKDKVKLDRLREFVALARPIAAAVPQVGAGVMEVANALDTRLRRPWKKVFHDISEAIRRIETPILVVVDDVDRLQPAELLDLLKLIRLLGRFPGIDYLLAYDERSVVETLQHSNGVASLDRARAFMEKIVQYPLHLPALLGSEILDLLEEGIGDIVSPSFMTTWFARSGVHGVFTKTLPALMKTPRAVYRFLAQVREQMAVHDMQEFDEIDLVLATCLRMHAPDLFASLPGWRTELVRQEPPFTLSTKKEQVDWTPLFEKVGPDIRTQVHAVVEAVFPVVGGRHLERYAHRRFAHPDYFDRYLLQSIPEDDVPDTRITTALAEASEGGAGKLRELIFDSGHDKAVVALSRIVDLYPDIAYFGQKFQELGSPANEVLLGTGMELWALVPDRRESWTSEAFYMKSWLVRLVRILFKTSPSIDLTPCFDRCLDIERRVAVIASASNEVEVLGVEVQDAFTRHLLVEVDRILPILVADLESGDSAEGIESYTFLYGIVAESERLGDLQTAVASGLEQGDFNIEDVAARFVGFSYFVGGSPTKPAGASFSGSLFTEVTGVPARSSDLSEKREWSDRSWPIRRAFAMEFVDIESKK